MKFLQRAQTVMSRAASNYDVEKLQGGISIVFLAILICLLLSRNGFLVEAELARSFFAILILTHGAMMFASSYVEEEQQFWYWISSGWLGVLGIKRWAEIGRCSLRCTH